MTVGPEAQQPPGKIARVTVPRLPHVLPLFEVRAEVQFKEHEWPLLYDLGFIVDGPDRVRLLQKEFPWRPSAVRPWDGTGRASLCAHIEIKLRQEGIYTATVLVDQTKTKSVLFEVRSALRALHRELRGQAS